MNYTWPGGIDISAFTATLGRPTILSLTAPAITAAGVMAKIDVASPLTVTWNAGKAANTSVLILLGATDVSGSAETSAYIVTRAVDDGSYTIPLTYMSTLPNKSWKANSYTQTFLVARIRFESMQVPLVGGGSGIVWLNTWVLPVYGVYTE